MNCVFTTLLLLSAASLVCLCTAKICPAVDFDADADVRVLGRLSYTDVITNVLTRRSSEQRVAIAQAFKKRNKKDLVDIFKGYKTNYGDLLVAMVTPWSDYYAQELYPDVGKYKPDSHAAVDILTTSSNAFMKAIYESYIRIYLDNEKPLPDQFKPDFKGLPTEVIMGQFQGIRNETQEVYWFNLLLDAAMINEYGLGDWYQPRKFDDSIRKMFAHRSFKYLHKLIKVYEEVYKKNITDAFLPWRNDLGYGAKHMIDVLRSEPDYFSRRLRDTMAGWFTNDDSQFIRIIVGHSETDLDEIKDAFQKRYNKPLSKRIEEAFSDDEYRHALLAIVNSICSYQNC